MKGIILAGGLGTRLSPLTLVTNKHLLPVYDRPMIEYPLRTLIDAGCDDILIVTGDEHVGAFAEYLGDGSTWHVRLTYRVQNQAGGIAQALSCAEGFINQHEVFPVILGDNFFQLTPKVPAHPMIYVSQLELGAFRFGIYDTKTKQITEKPKGVTSGLAVTGFYVYDYKVFSYLKTLQPSERGELEITDVNNWYLGNGMEVLKHTGKWSDMGTFDSLLEVANFVEDVARFE